MKVTTEQCDNCGNFHGVHTGIQETTLKGVRTSVNLIRELTSIFLEDSTLTDEFRKAHEVILTQCTLILTRLEND